jgi:hypothetical protein
LCQALLLNRELDEIRISAYEAYGTPTARANVVYAYARRPGCPRAFAYAEQSLRETQTRASRGECIIATVDGTWRASPKLVVASGTDWPARWHLLHTDRRFTRYELFESSEPRSRLVARQTDLSTSVVSVPLAYGPLPSYGLKIDMGVWRKSIQPAQADMETVLRRVIGLRVEPIPDSPTEPAIVTAQKILDSSGTELFGPELMVSINRVVDDMKRQETLSPADISFLQRLVADRRVSDHFQVYLVLQRWPAVGSGMIEPILDRLERVVPESTGHNHSHLAWILARAPIQALRPFAARIMSVAALSDQWHYAPLLRVAGQLGVDPTDLLTSRLLGPPSNGLENAVVAVCLADEPWRARLLPAVETVLERYSGRTYNGQKYLSIALLTLGENNQAAASLLARLPEPDAKRLRTEADYGQRHDCPRR